MEELSTRTRSKDSALARVSGGRPGPKYAVAAVAGASALYLGIGLPGFVCLLIALIAVTLALRGTSRRAVAEVVIAPEDDTKAIRRSLSRCQYLDKVDAKHAERGLAQLESSQARWATFERTLQERFTPGELAYGRYRGAAQEVHRAIRQNLRKATELLRHADAAAPTGTRAVDSTASNGFLTQASELLNVNEQSLQELDRVSQAVLDIKNSKSDPVDLERAMEQLRDLAARAQKYSTH